MKEPNEILRGDNSLLSTIVSEIRIFKDENGILNISIRFDNFSSKSDYNFVELLFVDVKEYSFYHNQLYNFYNVETFKFLKKDENYYLSLDPDDSTDLISEEDMDYIISKNIKMFENFSAD